MTPTYQSKIEREDAFGVVVPQFLTRIDVVMFDSLSFHVSIKDGFRLVAVS